MTICSTHNVAVVLRNCDGTEACHKAIITNRQVVGRADNISGRNAEVPIEPYSTETMHVRLPYLPSANIDVAVEVYGNAYYPYALEHYPAANRSVLKVLRPTLDGCRTQLFDLYNACQDGDANHHWQSDLVASDVTGLLWHNHTSVLDNYDTRRMDEYWMIFMEDEYASLLGKNSVLRSGDRQYKVVSVKGLNSRTRLPHVDVEVSPWPVANVS